MNLPPPPIREPFTAPAWVMWFQSVYQALRAPVSGTTAARPTVVLFVGQCYFDTDLGVPIWWNGAIWVDASGSTV